MEIFFNIVRIVLVILAVWHLFRREWKPAGSLALVLALTYLPPLLNRWLGIELDPLGGCLYVSVLVMTVYLGNTIKCYDRFSWWDRLIHLLSGVVFVNFGIALARKVDGLPIFGAVLFAFCLSITGHCIWELLEYASDCFGRSDHQRWQAHHPDINHKPAAALQPAGLVDTMNDMLLGLIGALAAAALWYLIL